MPDKQVQFEQPSALLLFFNRFWIIITAILVGVLLLGGYYLLIQPKINSNDDLRDSALQTTVDQQNSEQLLRNLEELKTTYESIQNNRQADLKRLQEIVPSNPQVAELFVLTDRLAKEYGFHLEDINITEAEDVQAAASAPADNEDEVSAVPSPVAAVQKNKNILPLKKLNINFSVSPVAPAEGTAVESQATTTTTTVTFYKSFKDFLDAMEKNLRLTDIQTVNFSSLQENTKNPPRFSFSVQTYYR